LMYIAFMPPVVFVIGSINMERVIFSDLMHFVSLLLVMFVYIVKKVDVLILRVLYVYMYRELAEVVNKVNM
jgi:hypothetical protein